jgi:uncharacterized protein with NAD-binding domain and iron-sulfur cluster
MAKRKIAILGGGWGSISTALYLTDPNNPHRDDYDITIYQMGWRLGGKGASGRGRYGRIEEHGLHVWMGFYENSFRLIRDVYDEVQPIYQRITNYENTPFRSWRDAFKPHNYIVLADHHDNRWTTWGFDFPENDELPGDGEEGVWLSPFDYVKMLLEWMLDFHARSSASDRTADKDEREGILGHLAGLVDSVTDQFGNAAHSALKLAVNRINRSDAAESSILWQIAASMDSFLTGVFADTRELFGSNNTIRRDATVLEMGAVTVKGLIADGVASGERDLDDLDEEDLRHWLHRHGASAGLLRSPMTQGIYDLVFAYENGEVNRPSFAAGVAIRAMVRMTLTYRGAIFWKMQAGMGDTVFAPPYLVLRERGVTFRFFHAVEDLHLDADGNRVESIDLGVQATLKDSVSEYWPLLNVKDLPCWPAEPNYDQLEQGEALRRRGINLESFYTEWTPVERHTLRRGADFDDVVLGISIGSFPYMAKALMDANDRFRAMVDNVATVRTMSAQFWFDRSLPDMGWTQPSPVMASYVEPLNTWADMSQLIPVENHPEGGVGNIAYLTGPMEGGIPPASKHDEPALAHERVRQLSLQFLESLSGFLWPDTVPERDGTYAENADGTDFDRLVAPDQDTAIAKFDAQFFRPNIDPSQRYVQTLPGTTKYRLGADESGFANVYLTGDWIWNGFNSGAIEPTTWSGIHCATAISGYPGKRAIVHWEPRKTADSSSAPG